MTHGRLQWTLLSKLCCQLPLELINPWGPLAPPRQGQMRHSPTCIARNRSLVCFPPPAPSPSHAGPGALAVTSCPPHLPSRETHPAPSSHTTSLLQQKGLLCRCVGGCLSIMFVKCFTADQHLSSSRKPSAPTSWQQPWEKAVSTWVCYCDHVCLHLLDEDREAKSQVTGPRWCSQGATELSPAPAASSPVPVPGGRSLVLTGPCVMNGPIDEFAQGSDMPGPQYPTAEG